jgi:hypothetical protein
MKHVAAKEAIREDLEVILSYLLACIYLNL